VVTALLAFVAGTCGVLGVASLRAPSLDRRPRSTRSGAGPALRRALTSLGRAIGRSAVSPDLAQRIVAAGGPAGMGPRELLATKVGAAAAVALPGAGVGALAPGRLGVLLVAAVPVAGFFAPDLWLARRAQRRARTVRRELPQLLDLLRVTIDAGTALPEALRAVGARGAGPLAIEWRAVGREVAAGSSLESALADMEARVPLPEVGALARALERTRRHGVPLSETLASQARDARLGLARRVREEAARAAPKIQLAVALMLVPSVLLLVAAALVAALAGSGGVEL
jgi:tight adherence protein C